MTTKKRLLRLFQNKKLLLVAALGMALVLIVWYFSTTDMAILNPKGRIATEQYHLLVIASLLSLLVILPVFVMTFIIVSRYRVDKYGKPVRNVKYTPNWSHNRRLETIWWGVPTALILVLSVIIVKSSYALDPFKPLQPTGSTAVQPLDIQVVALQWKWLFIFPDQRVASVNYLTVPTNTPLNFQITSDAPMNSLWIPQLGGQVYAMSGMSTRLHLQADQPGDYRGVSANISGDGFAGMKFTVHAVSNDEFLRWVDNIGRSARPIDGPTYAALAKPSKDNQPDFYSLPDKGLYDTVVMKYMGHGDMQPANKTYDMENMGTSHGSSHN
jgi:cytochrome o ubiquinol oxidase subunit 2